MIDPKLCSFCGLCADVCPVEAVNSYGAFRIDPNLCNDCGECSESCPSGAIKRVASDRR
ncbi:ATP-binding protein [Caproiciproducens sp.]